MKPTDSHAANDRPEGNKTTRAGLVSWLLYDFSSNAYAAITVPAAAEDEPQNS